MDQNQKLMKNIENWEKRQKLKKDKNLEKIVILVSKPIQISVTKKDVGTGAYYQDLDTRTGKMIFVGDFAKYQRMIEFMKDNGQWNEIDELYIYDRYHKNGDDMIKRSTMMLHEFSYTITIKKEYEHCWWNGEVAGCKLFDEYAFDPKNKAWDLE